MIVLYVALALIILMIMVTVHELGHYLAGKLLKFKITEFSIGFGKSIFSKTNKKTGEKFSVRLIPLGGYCAFDGQDDFKIANEGQFNSQKPWKRLIVLAAGGIFNIIFGLLTVVIMLMVVGYGARSVKSVPSIASTSPQFLQESDVIYKVDGHHLSIFKSIYNYIDTKEAGDTIELTVKRDGERINVTATIYEFTNSKGDTYLDIGSHSNYKYGFFESLGSSVRVTFNIFWETLVAIFKLFTGGYKLTDVSGPFGTIGAIATTTQQNFLIIFLLIPLITINLGLFNLLPLPALDGGRMVFVFIEMIRKKPINQNVEGWIHGIGLILLLSFVLLIDFIKIFI